MNANTTDRPAPNALPPPAALLQLLAGTWVAQAVSTCAELRLVDHLDPEAPRAAADVAAAAGAHGPTVYRLLRALAMAGVVVEHQGERFTTTPVGECLRDGTPSSMRELARMLGRPWHLATWGELTHSVRTGEAAFPRAIGRPLFDWFAAHPDESALFNQAMTGFSTMEVGAVLAAHDFTRYRRIADLGGGHGLMLAAALKAAPQARGVLLELPHVAAEARSTLAEAIAAGRCEIAAGDFFASAPAGCDAYLVKRVLHDWDDEACARLLGRVREGMAAGGRVLVVETVVPPRGIPAFSKLLDLDILVLTHGGRERTEAEFAALFARAGLRLDRITPTRAPSSVIEAVRA